MVDGTCNKSCNYKFATCTEVTGNKLTCNDPSNRTGSSCTCKAGYFENGANNPTCGSNFNLILF